MKALKIICLTVAVTLMLTGCGSSAINAPAPLSSQTPIMKATQGSASEDKDNDSPELSKGIPLVDACISKLEANKIDAGNDGMLILKRLSYCLNQLSNGKAFTTLKERSYSPIYDFGSFANMMDEDMLWKITNNTLSGEDPYKGVTGFIERAYVSETDQSLDSYVAYVPSGYVSNRSYPLIVLLHGYGGGAYLPPDSPAHAAFLKICEKYNVIMVAPNGKNKIPNVSVYHDDGEKDVLQVIKLAEKAYNIDTKRVYLTGMSMGGHGTWYIGSRHKNLFAAIAPVCGYAQGWGGSPKIAASDLAGMPTYVVHGEVDSVVPVFESRLMVDDMKKAGMEVEYKELKGVDHNAWDTAYGNDELVKWLLTHEKK